MSTSSSRYARLTPEQRKAKMLRIKKAQQRRHKYGKKLCTARTNLDKPCPQGRYIIEFKGKLYRTPWCFAHIPAEKRELWGIEEFGTNSNKDENKKQFRRPRFLDSLRETVENEVAEFMAPYREAMSAEKPVPVGNGRYARVEMVPDHRTRIQAVEAIADRAFGKPKQVQEISGPGGGPIVTEVPTDPEREKAVATILAESGALGAFSAHRNPASQN